jgi:hypothetical protein
MRIAVRSQSRQILPRDSYLEKPITKKGWRSGSRCRPWVQALVPKKKKLRILFSLPTTCEFPSHEFESKSTSQSSWIPTMDKDSRQRRVGIAGTAGQPMLEPALPTRRVFPVHPTSAWLQPAPSFLPTQDAGSLLPDISSLAQVERRSRPRRRT